MGSRKLKILHLSSEQHWRGGERQIAFLIGELGKAGHFNFVAAKKDGAFYSYCLKYSVPCIPLSFSNTVDLISAWKIKQYCRENSIDIVHMHSAKAHGIGVLSTILGNQVPLVLSRRVAFIPKQNKLTRWRYNHPSVKAIISVSQKITDIMKGFVEDPSRCETVYSGIDLSIFKGVVTNKLRKELQLPDDAILIGNTAALDRSKDYPTFIETIRILSKSNPNIRGVIIGKGDLAGELKQIVTSTGMESMISFTGFRDDIPEILPDLDVFLMTSVTEGLGTAVLDAFASNVPVVATETGGIPEMVIHNNTGLLCPVADSSCLAASIQRILQDRGLKARLVAAAKNKLNEFSRETMGAKTLDIYERILGTAARVS